MTTNNIAVVRTIGKGVRVTEEAVASIVASLPDGFDPKARGAVAEAVHQWACGDGERPALKTGARGEQVTTDYGRGHDTLVAAVKRAMKDNGPTSVTLRATLSGEGGAPAASSNQFPAGTKLKVTNLDNNKSTTVQVTSVSGSCALLNNAAFEQVREPGKFLIRRAVIEKVG